MSTNLMYRTSRATLRSVIAVAFFATIATQEPATGAAESYDGDEAPVQPQPASAGDADDHLVDELAPTLEPADESEPQPSVDLAAAVERCVFQLDLSGSVTDYPSTRSWFVTRLGWLLDAYTSVLPLAGTQFDAYGRDQHPLLVADDVVTPDGVIDAVVSLMGSEEWTDPLPAFREAAFGEHFFCVVHLTDGTLDLPPNTANDTDSYIDELLRVADALGQMEIPVITIALADDNRDLWREVAERTGGIYLVNPDSSLLKKVILDMLSRLSPTATPPSPTPTPRATETTDPPTPTVTPSATPNVAPGRPMTDSSAWLLVGISLGAVTASLAAISMIVRLRRTGPKLTGTLEIHRLKEEEDVR